jgi:hypothetical protein
MPPYHPGSGITRLGPGDRSILRSLRRSPMGKLIVTPCAGGRRPHTGRFHGHERHHADAGHARHRSCRVMSGGLAGEDSLISPAVTFGVQESAVTDNQKSNRGPLVRAGAAVCAAGAAVAATALAAKTRSWLQRMETPPRELASQQWTRAKAASAAAADTWRNGHPAKQAESVQPAESVPQAESVQPTEPQADSPAAVPAVDEVVPDLGGLPGWRGSTPLSAPRSASHHARHHGRVAHPDGVTQPGRCGPDACE